MPSRKRIAIAGGTGTIGQSIVHALCLNLLIADIRHPFPSRNRNPLCGHTSLDSLTTALAGVDTLISTLLIPGPEFVPILLNLLNASINAGVHRFAPSEFALSQSAHELVDLDHAKITIWSAVLAAVERGEIDTAAFPVGMFMNYLAVGIPDSQEREMGLAGFKEGSLMLHLERDPAVIEVPLSENGEWGEVCMTDIRDIGRFVVAALDLPEWGGRELGIVGERMKGRKEVIVKEVSLQDLEQRIEDMDEGDVLGRMDLQYMGVSAKGAAVVDGVLNILCPNVKPMGIKDFMDGYWT